MAIAASLRMEHAKQEELLAQGSATMDLRTNTIVAPEVGQKITLDGGPAQELLTYRPKHPRSARRRNLLCAVLTWTLCGAELCDDWRRHGMAEVMLAKLMLLRTHYSGMRRVRGDGNCFYRALAIGWLEWLVAAPPPQQRHVWETLVPSLTKRAAAVLPEAVRAEFGKLGETFAARAKHVCEQASSNLLTDTLLLSELKGPAAVAKMRWLRLLASSHMRAHHTDYEAVAMGLGKSSFEAFLEEEVEAMGVEADEPQVQALTTALNLFVRIEYLDSASVKWSDRCGPHRHVVCGPTATVTGASDAITATEADATSPASAGGAADVGVGAESASSAASSTGDSTAEAPPAPYLAACLLFRPGHYDVLLPSDPSDAAALAALVSTTPPAANTATDMPDSATSAAANPAFAPPLPPAPPSGKDKACPVCSSSRSSCLLCAAAVCPYRNCSQFGRGSGSPTTASPTIAVPAARDAEAMGIDATIDVTVPALFGCSANRAAVCNPCLYRLPVAGASADAATGGGDEARFQLYRSGNIGSRVVGFGADMAEHATATNNAAAVTSPVATAAAAAAAATANGSSSDSSAAAPPGTEAAPAEENTAVGGDMAGPSEAQGDSPEMQQLLEMGVDRQRAAAALQRAGGVQAAIQLLF